VLHAAAGKLAHLLHDACRTVDLIGRYGGEEFCIVFPGAGRDSVALLGERLLAAVRQHRIRGEHPITVSVGFASLPERGGDRSWSTLIHRADVALYQAKDMGRNRYCIATPEPIESAPPPDAASSRSSERYMALRVAETASDAARPPG
jgi:diguanylate cyclase (GGDEF)-like protein